MVQEEKVIKFKSRVKELYKIKKAELIPMVERLYRVSDFKKEPKDVIVSAILEAEFGRKFMREVNQ